MISLAGLFALLTISALSTGVNEYAENVYTPSKDEMPHVVVEEYRHMEGVFVGWDVTE